MSPGKLDTSAVRRHLLAIAGFRNVVVHGYLDVDVRILHRLLNERLEDFTEFVRRIEAYLAAAD